MVTRWERHERRKAYSQRQPLDSSSVVKWSATRGTVQQLVDGQERALADLRDVLGEGVGHGGRHVGIELPKAEAGQQPSVPTADDECVRHLLSHAGLAPTIRREG